MNALGKFLESKLGSQIIIATGFACCVWAYWEPLLATFVLSFLGLMVPQLTMYRNAQLAKHLAGEEEDE